MLNTLETETLSVFDNNVLLEQARDLLLHDLSVQLQAAIAMVCRMPRLLAENERWYGPRDNFGNLKLHIKLFGEPLELEKGQTYLIVSDDRDLPKLVQQCIEAVKSGHLDLQIEERVLEHQQSQLRLS